jgi:preprotein translocase SecE subunit
MALGIYKQGQGYWVRILTAAFAGIIVLVGCAWLWQSLQTVDLPKPTWSMNIASVVPGQAVSVAAGQTVSLVGDAAEAGGVQPEVGNAEVVSVEPSPSGVGQRLVVKKMEFKPKADVTQIRGVAYPAGTVVASVNGTPVGKPIFEPIYMQFAGVSVLVLVGGIAVFMFVGSRARSVEFLIATDGEMKKVNWSTRKDIIGSTQVVILWCVLLVVGLFLVDLAFSTFFRMIGVLQN